MNRARTSPLTASARRVFAWAAALLWVVGFELAPGVHMGWHAAWGTHTHDAGVEHHDHDHDHDHDHTRAHEHDGDHDRVVDVAAAGVGRDATARGPSMRGLGHGAHSVAHRQLATAVPPAAMPVVATAPWRFVAMRRRASEPARSRSPRTRRARGPPAIG